MTKNKGKTNKNTDSKTEVVNEPAPYGYGNQVRKDDSIREVHGTHEEIVNDPQKAYDEATPVNPQKPDQPAQKPAQDAPTNPGDRG